MTDLDTLANDADLALDGIVTAAVTAQREHARLRATALDVVAELDALARQDRVDGDTLDALADRLFAATLTPNGERPL